MVRSLQCPSVLKSPLSEEVPAEFLLQLSLLPHFAWTCPLLCIDCSVKTSDDNVARLVPEVTARLLEMLFF